LSREKYFTSLPKAALFAILLHAHGRSKGDIMAERDAIISHFEWP
jgi:hypothetical protein